MLHKIYACALGLCTSAFVQAQTDTLIIDQYSIDEITISANKTPEKAILTPASVTNISGYQFSQRHYQKLNDLTAIVPNLYMPDYGTQLTSPIYIRGIGARINEPAVGLYVDGVPYYDKGALDFDLLDVEQVEVLRGPQGTLYGRNTMGGLIHVLTEKPTTHPKTQAKIGYGNYNSQKYSLIHHQPLSHSFFAKITAQYNKRNGYFDNSYTGNPSDNVDSYQGNIQLRWKGDKSDVLGTVGFSSTENQGFAYKQMQMDNGSAQVAYDYPSGYERDMTTTALKWSYRLNKGEITSISSFQYIDDQHIVDQDFSIQDLFRVNQERKQSLGSQELRYNYNNERIAIISGVYGFIKQLDKTVTVAYGSDAQTIYKTPAGYCKDKVYDNLQWSGAAFSQLTIREIGSFMDVSLGLRYDYEHGSMDYREISRIEQKELRSADTTPTRNFHQWLPKITVKFPINQRGNIYATLTKGFKTGGFNSTFEKAAHISFDAEHSWNYELGMRYKWWKNKLVTNVALFYIDWDNQQIYQPVPSGRGSMLTNAGESQSYGLEAELLFRPVKNLLINGNIGYTNATFIDYEKNPEDEINLKNNYLPYIPRYNMNVGVQYRIPVASNLVQSITLGTDYAHQGKQYWTEENTVTQQDFGLLNGFLQMETGSFQISLWMKNIMNQSYQAFYFEALNNQYEQSGVPRIMGMTLTYNGIW